MAFVKQIFQDYYSKHFSPNSVIAQIEKREFGFLLFEGYMLRHKSFQTNEHMAEFLRTSVPRDAYVSCAYYESPMEDMEKKNWQGADLIFDIDADHIPTACDKIHDEWICGVCGFIGKGIRPEKCPACCSERFQIHTWPCENCLASAKGETAKLLEMLKSDFGFSEKETRVFFSGHRGYHVAVEDESVQELDAVARKEIVDYVCGIGFNTGFSRTNKKSPRKRILPTAPSLNSLGWQGRLAKNMYDFIHHADEMDLSNLGFNRKIVRTILRNKNQILRNWEDGIPYKMVRNVGFETWKRIAEVTVVSASAKVDTVVTTDIHRLIRLTDTLHGKTGFRKVELAVKDLYDFDPFTSAIAFNEGSETFLVSSAPSFRLGEETFGPFKEEKVELPIAAGALLVCKGRAEVTV